MKQSIFAICFGALFTASAFANSTVSPYMKVGAKGTIIDAQQAASIDNASEASSEESTETTTDDAKKEYKVMPMIGVGVRQVEGNFGYDVSADYSWKKEGEETIYSYTAPKLMVLGYLYPQKATSLYAGLGASWSGVEINENTFHGLFGNATLGAEIKTSEKTKAMIEANCDVPALAASSQGERPYPLVSLRVGLGF